MLCTLPACSLILDANGLSGKDAGDATDASDVQTPMDVSTTDVNDAAILDASDVMDAGVQPFCASLMPKPKLCEDFDSNNPFDFQFSSKNVSPTAMLGSDTNAFVSSPNSLSARLAMVVDAGSSSVAYMSRNFVGTASKITYAFDLRVDQIVAGGKSGVLGGFLIDPGSPSEHDLTMYVTDTYASLEEVFKVNNVYQYVDHKLAIAPKLGAWTRIVISADLVARTVDVTVGGMPALAMKSLDNTWNAGAPTFNVGFTYASGQAMPWAAHYDNVVIDWM